ncbi:acyl-CoA dehydrogenase family protein [Candidatus Moduliflexota bacterium]
MCPVTHRRRKGGREGALLEKGIGKAGFLENLYLTGSDPASFRTLAPRPSDGKADGIIATYNDLIAAWSPDRLEASGDLPPELLGELGRIGLFGLNIPEEYGGAGLSLPGYLKVLENIARKDMALALIPTAHLSIGLKGILLYGNEEQKSTYLPPAAKGEMIFAYALTEPKTGSDAKHIETRADLAADGSHYILNGHKTYITNANYAGGLTVFAQLDPKEPGRMGAFIVETAWDGVKIGADMAKMGLAISSTAAISFKDVKVPAGNLLGERGDGFRIAMMVLNYGRMGLGAASVGVMEQSREDMSERAAARKQFGVPIGDFPLVQEKIVRASVHAFVGRAMTSVTARLFEDDPTANAALESSHTKLYGSTRAWDTLYDALQVAGGSGYLATQPYEKRMRDFRVTTVFEGTTEIHSVYPALFLLRALGKRAGKGPVSRFYGLLRGLLTRNRWALSYDDREMNRAARRAGKYAARVRKLAHLALMIHGKRVVKREFLLRRITRMSVAVFGIISTLVQVDSLKKKGGDGAAEMRLLRYFLEEVGEEMDGSNRLGDSPREKIHRQIVRDLTQ